MGTSSAEITRLRECFERIAISGIKLVPDSSVGSAWVDEHNATLELLLAAGLALREGNAIVLCRPEFASIEIPPESLAVFHALYEYWLRRDDSDSDDTILYGEVGFWQHWWNVLNERIAKGSAGPLHLDAMMADDGTFTNRAWVNEFDRDLVDHVFEHNLMTGRAIVPPSTLDSPAESLIDAGLQVGFNVRVLSATSMFWIFDGSTVILPEKMNDEHPESQRLTTRPSVVDPLQQLFEVQWAAATPWDEFTKGSIGILQLLARGWTDSRIADTLGVSQRTVSRRVTRAMKAAGAQSRFELGMKFARSVLDAPPDENPPTLR